MVLLLLSILLLLTRVYGGLNYSNQNSWGGICSTGKLQSPISLDHVLAKYVAGLATKFDYPFQPVATNLSNTDSTLRLDIRNFFDIGNFDI